MNLLSAYLGSWTTSKKAKAVRNLPSCMRMYPKFARPAFTGVPLHAGLPLGTLPALCCLLLPTAAFQVCRLPNAVAFCRPLPVRFVGKLLPFRGNPPFLAVRIVLLPFRLALVGRLPFGATPLFCIVLVLPERTFCIFPVTKQLHQHCPFPQVNAENHAS